MRFLLEQIVVFFVPERIVMFVALELDVELYPGEARLLLLGLTQFLGGIRFIVLDTSADIDTNIIAQGITVFTGIKKLNYAYAIGSLNLDYISVCAG